MSKRLKLQCQQDWHEVIGFFQVGSVRGRAIIVQLKHLLHQKAHGLQLLAGQLLCKGERPCDLWYQAYRRIFLQRVTRARKAAAIAADLSAIPYECNLY